MYNSPGTLVTRVSVGSDIDIDNEVSYGISETGFDR